MEFSKLIKFVLISLRSWRLGQERRYVSKTSSLTQGVSTMFSGLSACPLPPHEMRMALTRPHSPD